MARRPLPRILSNGSARIARSRELARSAADSAADVLHPLITVTRGLRRLAGAGRRRWAETPKDRRGPLLFLVASVFLVVVLMPYGPLLAAVALMAAAAWQGRDRTSPAPAGPDEAQAQRLASLYEALVPYFSVPEDPAPLYAHGGEWEKAFTSYAFDGDGRVERLTIRYPAYFTDGEARSRARIEQLLHAKSGRGREYRFDWDEEGNLLTLSVLPPLPVDIAAQRFVTSPGETVLGFTDAGGVQRTLPLGFGEEKRDVPPVVWRTGPRSTEPHLLAVGEPGSGTTTLLRSVALQALRHGDVLVVEGGGTGEYAFLTGRAGVLAVESGVPGSLASLEWAAHETERRLAAAHRARQEGRRTPEDVGRPLWILVDRPSVLAHLAAADGRRDPWSLLRTPLRHGRAARVTVVVAEQFDGLESLGDVVTAHTRARVVLGPASPERLAAVLGTHPPTTPTPRMPLGRGYARLGTGPVHRLQVPATPDPYDDATSEVHRRAVLALLPPLTTPADAAVEGASVPDAGAPDTASPDTGSAGAVPLDTAPPQAVPADSAPVAAVLTKPALTPAATTTATGPMAVEAAVTTATGPMAVEAAVTEG